MRLHRFFISHTLAGQSAIVVRDQELYHQLKNVFRFQVGARLILLDNSGSEFEALLTAIELGNLNFEILNAKKVQNLPQKEIFLFQSLIKKDNFEWVLEKGTELGVSHFIPVLSERSEKKKLNMERAEKILKEASEQSGRGNMPTLSEIISLEDVLKKKEVSLIAFHLEGGKFPEGKFASEKQLGVLIGPEGGWSDRELELFKKNSVQIFSLGQQVLRAETAAIAVSSLLLL